LYQIALYLVGELYVPLSLLLVDFSCIFVGVFVGFRLVAAGFLLLSSSAESGVSFFWVSVVFCVSFVCRLGVEGGEGCANLLATLLVSGVIAVDANTVGGLFWFVGVPVSVSVALSVGVGVFEFVGVPMTVGANDNLFFCTFVHVSVSFVAFFAVSFAFSVVLVAAKASLVCRALFSSISFPCAILVCFVFSPRLGDDAFLLVPEGEFRFDFRVMVDCSRSFGTFVA
jgi:hypothetical protein